MPEIKTTRRAQQIQRARAAIEDAAESAKRDIDAAATKALAMLEVDMDAREVVVAPGGVLDRSQHVFVGLFDARNNTGLGGAFDDVSVELRRVCRSIRISEPQDYSSAGHPLPRPKPCMYRVWVAFEPLEDTE